MWCRLLCWFARHDWRLVAPTAEEIKAHRAMYGFEPIYESAYYVSWNHSDRVCGRCRAINPKLQRRLGRTDAQMFAREFIDERARLG